MKTIGIDGGGSGTRFVLWDEEKGVLRIYHSKMPSNYHLVGINNVKKVFEEGIEHVSGGEKFDAVGAGLSGVDREEDMKVVSNVFKELNVDKFFISNDALTALWGALRGVGILMIAGTGSIVIGRNEKGEVSRAGGWGYLLEEYGSGYWFANKAAVAVLQARDGMTKKTSLTRRLLDFYGIKKEGDLVYVYYSNFDKSEIAAVAPIVFEEAQNGDEVAVKIVEEGVSKSLDMIGTVREKCEFNESFEFSYGGGVFSSKFFMKVFKQAFSKTFPPASFKEPKYDAATGAAIMALRNLKEEKP